MAAGGSVFLVEAGPGDPGLITAKGTRCLGIADVIVCDRLVNQQLLQLARQDAEIVRVETARTLSPGEVRSLLVARAEQGQTVVLLGADLLVYSNSGDQIQALAEAGVRFEVVPGVTSAIAVPIYAGIPLLHSRSASALSISAAPQSTKSDPLPASSEVVPTGASTSVFLADTGSIPTLIRRLAANGYPMETPIAVTGAGLARDKKQLLAR